MLPPTTVYRPAAACTVTVVAAVDAAFSDADTVAVPPFSAIALLDSVSDAVGASSSAFVPDTVTVPQSRCRRCRPPCPPALAGFSVIV